jgi:hypothetical protein
LQAAIAGAAAVKREECRQKGQFGKHGPRVYPLLTELYEELISKIDGRSGKAKASPLERWNPDKYAFGFYVTAFANSRKRGHAARYRRQDVAQGMPQFSKEARARLEHGPGMVRLGNEITAAESERRSSDGYDSAAGHDSIGLREAEYAPALTKRDRRVARETALALDAAWNPFEDGSDSEAEWSNEPADEISIDEIEQDKPAGVDYVAAAAWKRLTYIQRRVLVARSKNLSTPEIARRLRLSETAVKRLVRAARHIWSTSRTGMAFDDWAESMASVAADKHHRERVEAVRVAALARLKATRSSNDSMRLPVLATLFPPEGESRRRATRQARADARRNGRQWTAHRMFRCMFNARFAPRVISDDNAFELLYSAYPHLDGSEDALRQEIRDIVADLEQAGDADAAVTYVTTAT